VFYLWRKKHTKEDSAKPIISDKVHNLDAFIKSAESRIAELKYRLDTMGGTENQQAKAELEESMLAFETTVAEMKRQAAALPQMAKQLAAALENPGDSTERIKQTKDNAKDAFAGKLSEAKARADTHNSQMQMAREIESRNSRSRNGGGR
jgi:chromosome segregation ATPase